MKFSTISVVIIIAFLAVLLGQAIIQKSDLANEVNKLKTELSDIKARSEIVNIKNTLYALIPRGTVPEGNYAEIVFHEDGLYLREKMDFIATSPYYQIFCVKHPVKSPMVTDLLVAKKKSDGTTESMPISFRP